MAKSFKNKIKLRSQIVFNKKIAIRLTKSDYYKVLGDDVRTLPSREKEKSKYSTTRKDKVTKLIKHYKELLESKSQGTFHVLKGIYNTNIMAARKMSPPPKHTNLVSLAASIPNLIVAYRQIRSNKGAMTLGAMLSYHKTRVLNPLQRRLLSSTSNSPDGISYWHFKCTSDLLKQGKYPWGSSRRIYIDKPGQPDKKRPITIPPFMDKVVQTAILRVLEAIYEPWFEIQNRSFGFRQRKGVHDAIYALTRKENKGLHIAIEGDIKGAYDNVDREKLIQILSKRINDRKFLKLIRERLDYQFFDTLTNKYVEEEKGIPQGGIDSPYLWNIYMNEFDNHIQTYMDQLMDSLNKKIRPKAQRRSKIITKELSSVLQRRKTLQKELQLLQKIRTYEKFQTMTKRGSKGAVSIGYHLKKYFKNKESLISTPNGLLVPSSTRYNIIKQIRQTRHRQRNIPSTDPNKSLLRYTYVRYADDWIILGNFSKLLAEKIKSHIKEWLKENLNAELAEEKTLITDFRKPDTPARFLGFEIRSFFTRSLKYKKSGNSDKLHLTRVAGAEIKAYPDQQRLISRLNMKGYCDKKGNPRPVSWISTLETFALISRWNSVLRGIGNYYYGFVPKSSLNRWIYIIRFSLLKTLAQKYNTNIKNIFSRFGIRTETGNTIEYTVRNIFNKGKSEEVREKRFTLLTETQVQTAALKLNRFIFTKNIFNKIEYDKRIYIPGRKRLSFPFHQG
jgi:retron-type reverse transcriptase